MSKEKKPEIRFKGFEDEWSIKKIGNILSIGNGSDYKHLDKGEIPVFGTGGLMTKVDKYLYDGESVFIGRKGTIDKPMYYRGKFWTVDTLFFTYNFIQSIPKFVYPLFQTINWYSYNAATGVPSLSKETINQIEINLPVNTKEQKSIGNFFSNIDNLIMEAEKEIDKLETLKQASLYKMFPRPGSSVPEIRIKRFSEPWEIKKLFEIATKVSDKNEGYVYNETFSCSAEHGIINQQEFFDHSISKDNKINGYYVLKPNYYVYNPRISTLAPYGPINRNKTGRIGVISPLYLLFKIFHNVDYDYIDWFFKTDLWHNFMKLNGDSGARHDRFTIRTETFFQMPIVLPSFEEQQAIASYFNNLEEIISLKRKKLSKLRQIKEALLDKMFVNID